MDDLQPLDYLGLAALGLVALATAAGVVWIVIQLVNLLYATGYGPAICSAVLLLLMGAAVIARN